MRYSTILMAALLSLAPAAAFAHPHIFVEARLEVVADKDGSVEELRNVWRFDEVFSSSVVMDFDKNTDLKLEPNELAEVGKTVKQSLAEYDYYMNLTINGKNITVQKPDIIHVDYKDGQLLMFFAVKPAEKMPLKGRLTFGVYDPSLYTSIDFPTDNELSLVGDGFKACKHQVVRPDADQVISQNKQSLTDAFFNDPTGTNMSKLFATRLEVTC
ncbi:ABC-type uncharacterized transport system substrate-binding protein [Rhizobium leguminosarum]|uniref:ABC-type uncharacterized transport system substrate-binding protein n=1 Tax=Rhizobium leguminosarum TaxID=384 RepID=A0AAE2SYA0_RHILE|nr:MULTISPECIES: DUF1007 family protein [Rhizobium]MBB4292781.1 ABC-type uncharacterized transport system substrate-binding protein [Rhizobium leguminosarum]MBB4310682.1 ABC-type uncharacterized transport system substrate-binding protein [Rhizobium leguminosarum]MBB4434947.1 ABC-type uncharacterized transport system substrate-binding protein [Rhizobium esperanzae]MBB4531676.1 ABC-type uncharacterized transport system substrate-binding protein [Rhizobium leguminosarum]MBB5654212.1 ABC-type unch